MRSGVVWYNRTKLVALRRRAALEGGKKREDDAEAAAPPAPALSHRSKEDILREIRRLQQQLEPLGGGGGVKAIRAPSGGGALPVQLLLHADGDSPSSAASSTIAAGRGLDAGLTGSRSGSDDCKHED